MDWFPLGNENDYASSWYRIFGLFEYNIIFFNAVGRMVPPNVVKKVRIDHETCESQQQVCVNATNDWTSKSASTYSY